MKSAMQITLAPICHVTKLKNRKFPFASPPNAIMSATDRDSPKDLVLTFRKLTISWGSRPLKAWERVFLSAIRMAYKTKLSCLYLVGIQYTFGK